MDKHSQQGKSTSFLYPLYRNFLQNILCIHLIINLFLLILSYMFQQDKEISYKFTLYRNGDNRNQLGKLNTSQKTLSSIN